MSLLLITPQCRLLFYLWAAATQDSTAGLMENLCTSKFLKLQKLRKGALLFSQLSKRLKPGKPHLLCMELSSWNCTCLESNSAKVYWRPTAQSWDHSTICRKAIHSSSKNYITEWWLAGQQDMTFNSIPWEYFSGCQVGLILWTSKFEERWCMKLDRDFPFFAEVPRGTVYALFPKSAWPRFFYFVLFWCFFWEHLRGLVSLENTLEKCCSKPWKYFLFFLEGSFILVYICLLFRD